MDLYSVNGLPLHVLLVHLVVVLVPVTALAVLFAAVFPGVRRRLGIVLPALGLAVIVLVPLTTQAGAWLQARVAPTALIGVHAGLGGRSGRGRSPSGCSASWSGCGTPCRTGGAVLARGPGRGW